MSHPGTDELWRLLADELPAEEAAPALAHVNGCAECLDRLEALQRPGTDDALWLADLLMRPPPEDGPDPAPPAEPDAQHWPTFAGHDLLERVGGGGMGEVYRARHRLTGRVVALKTLAAVPASAEALARFRTEVQAVSRLQHPHVVTVYEVGEEDGRPYFTMEWLGDSLANHLDRPLPPDEAARLLLPLAGAVHAIHATGVVHRDLKPANVLLAGGGREPAGTEEPAGSRPPLAGSLAKVTDFGIARLLDQDSSWTRPGQGLGTPEYMAPEQAAGETVGPAADVYALGVILYECLTGRPPFHGATPLQTVEQARTQEPVSPARLNARLPRDLETICLKCLEKEAARRYTSAGALADDLQRYLDGRPIAARPVGLVRRLARWARRHPLPLALVGLAALALALLLVVLRTRQQVEAGRTARARDLALAVHSQLSLLRHAVGLTARQDDLRLRLDAGDPHRLQEFLNAAKADFNKWFTWSGTDPLVTLFVLDPEGTLLGVARPDPKTVGRNFRLRDYVRPFLDGAEPGQTHVSAVFPSKQDGMFKFGVVAPVHDGGRLLGLLAASIPVDARLVSLDMRRQGAGASVLGPMDWSYVDEAGPQVLAVLDGRYAEPGRGPLWADAPARALMERLNGESAASLEAEGEALSGVRVDGSPFVAVVREPQPWGLVTPRMLWLIAAALAGGVLVWRWRRG